MSPPLSNTDEYSTSLGHKLYIADLSPNRTLNSPVQTQLTIMDLIQFTKRNFTPQSGTPIVDIVHFTMPAYFTYTNKLQLYRELETLTSIVATWTPMPCFRKLDQHFSDVL